MGRFSAMAGFAMTAWADRRFPRWLTAATAARPRATAPVVLSSWLHRTAWRTMITAYIFISAAQRDLLAPVGLPADRSFVKHNFVPAAAVRRRDRHRATGRLCGSS